MMNDLQIVEYNGVRVITSRQVSDMYGCKPKDISNAFNNNKKRYTEGKHYFQLSGDELKAFRIREDLQSQNLGVQNLQSQNCGTQEETQLLPMQISNKTRILYLWTNKGALLLAKSINTDTAWQAYERLVDFYFEVKEEFNPPIEKFPEEQPRTIYQTSSTPVPKNPSWQARNRRRINALCEKANTSVSNLYHHVLLRLGEEYDLNAANRIYEEEIGHTPRYAMDIVSYFPELARMADAYLDKIEEVTEKQLNK